MALATNNQKVDNYVVAQHNNLVEANYSAKLTSRALKVARLLISTLNPDNSNLETIDIKINALKQFLGYKNNVTWGRFHTDLKDIAKRLNKEPIEISLGKGKTFVAFFISSYTLDIPEGKISFDIAPKLKPYLLSLKNNYTSYLLINIPRLRSSYSIRLYELLHQYRKIGKRYFNLIDLQKKVGSNYSSYSNFKIKVLKQAQKDVKKYTDLAFVFNEVKTSRKVTGIEFIIFGNTPEEKRLSPQLELLKETFDTQELEQNKPALSEKIILTLNKLGISEQNIAKYLSQGFDIIASTDKKSAAKERCTSLENYYLEKLELLQNSSSGQVKTNSAGFLIKALKEDWVSSQSLKAHQQKIAIKKLNQVKQKLNTIENQIKKLSTKRDKIHEKIMSEFITDNQLLESIYQEVISEMGNFGKKYFFDISSLPIIKQYQKSPMLKTSIDAKIRKMHSQTFDNIIVIEQNIEQLEKEAKKLRKEHYL